MKYNVYNKDNKIVKIKKMINILKEISNTCIYNEIYSEIKEEIEFKNLDKNIVVLNSKELSELLKYEFKKIGINTIVVKGYVYRDKTTPFYYNKVELGSIWYNLVLFRDIKRYRYNLLPFFFLVDDKLINEFLNIEYIESGVENFNKKYISKVSFVDENNNEVHKYEKILLRNDNDKYTEKQKRKITKLEVSLYNECIDNGKYIKYSDEYIDNAVGFSLTEFIEKEEKELENIPNNSIFLGYYNNEKDANELLTEEVYNKLYKYRNKFVEMVFKFPDVRYCTSKHIEMLKKIHYTEDGRKISLYVYFSITNCIEKDIFIMEKAKKELERLAKEIYTKVSCLKLENNSDLNLHNNICEKYPKLNIEDAKYIHNIMGKDTFKFFMFIEIMRTLAQRTIFDLKLSEAHEICKQWAEEESKIIERKNKSICKIFEGNLICQSYMNLIYSMCVLLDIPCIYISYNSHAWNKIQLNDNWYNVDLSEDSLNIWWLEDLTSILKSDKYFCDKEKNTEYIPDKKYIANIDFDSRILTESFYSNPPLFNKERRKYIKKIIYRTRQYLKTGPIKLYNEIYNS